MGLRLVEITNENYHLDRSLQESEEVVIKDEELSSLLMSILDWKLKVKGVISKTISRDEQFEFRISSDEESREVEFLILNINNSMAIDFLEGERVELKLTLFNQNLRFETVVLEAGENNELYIDIPELILKHTVRSGERKKVQDENLNIITVAGEQAEVLDVSPRAIRLRMNNRFSEESFTCYFNDKKMNLSVMKTEENSVTLEPSDRETQLVLFNFYVSKVYPTLRSIKTLNPEDLTRIYMESGYFSKFQTDSEVQCRVEELESVNKRKIQNESTGTLDYAICNEDEVTGASSCTLAFKTEKEEYWAFHQLCSLKKHDLLNQSGILYKWRADFLSSFDKKDKVFGIGWFDSRSRWLERIYTKFHLMCSESRLHEMQVFRINIESLFPVNSKKINVYESTEKIAGEERTFLSNNSIIAGCGPKFLNASNILDAAVCLDRTHNFKDIDDILKGLSSKQVSPYLEVTTLNKETEALVRENYEYEEVNDVDRFFVIPKNYMGLFNSSVDHSIAVTEKKIKRYGKQY